MNKGEIGSGSDIYKFGNIQVGISMAKNAEGLAVEEVPCAAVLLPHAARVPQTRGKRQVVSRLQQARSLSLFFSSFTADDGNGSHGKRPNISAKNRKAKNAWFAVM